MDQAMFKFVYIILLTFYSSEFMIITLLIVCVNLENVYVFWNSIRDVELYVIKSLIRRSINVPKILYIITNDKGVHDVWIRFIIINKHVLQLVVFEKVLEEAVTILLVVIITTINPTQVLQGNDVIAIVGVKATVDVPQINTLVHVRYFNFLSI